MSLLKNPGGENQKTDIIMCWYCLMKTYYEGPYRKNSYMENIRMWCLVSCDLSVFFARTFQLWSSLASYEAHYDLSWFRPLLEGNSFTSSGLILKMNMYYKGVSRELEKFKWWKGKVDLVPPAWRVRGLL
jgi:hypothetical protein